jgi:hypothetical protein
LELFKQVKNTQRVKILKNRFGNFANGKMGEKLGNHDKKETISNFIYRPKVAYPWRL